ncbi:unnamed protein product [Linum trigynum]|uniref:Gnk2-homologous domain-containing protein n=1 Tax=Linum trigynum TaxID=586398 RepID=A0AAV2GX24_9ROSI
MQFIISSNMDLRKAVMAVVVVVAGYLTVAVAQPARRYCASVVPEDPVAYSSNAEKVMNILVTRAPPHPAHMFKSWYPYRKVGSVAGAAICYHNDVGKCSACLNSLKASLDGCKMSTTGGSFSGGCNMQFWKIVD